jgi:MFS family permease
MVMQAFMMPSVGWLRSRLGNRRLYLLSLGTFVGGSILCGMAWDVYLAHCLSRRAGDWIRPLFPLT